MQLSINFATGQRRLNPRSSALGYVMLLAGGLALAAAGWDFWQQSEEKNQLQAERNALRHEARRRQGGDTLPATLQNQIEQANKAYALLQSPWDEVFMALESAYAHQESSKAAHSQGMGDIGLLLIKADAVRQELALSGQARNFNALNALSKALSESGKFAHVTLANHKLSEGAAPVVVIFDLRMNWSSPGSAER